MKVDAFLEELILYLYYFKAYSIRDIVSEINLRTNKKLSHTAVHKVIKRAQYKDYSPELLEWIRTIEEQTKPRILEFASVQKFTENEDFQAITFKKEELEQKLGLDGSIYSVLFDTKTKSVTIVYEKAKKKRG